MSRKDMQSDEIEEIMKEMLNDDEYADEGFEDIDREDNRHESKKAMKKEKKADRILVSGKFICRQDGNRS